MFNKTSAELLVIIDHIRSGAVGDDEINRIITKDLENEYTIPRNYVGSLQYAYSFMNRISPDAFPKFAMIERDRWQVHLGFMSQRNGSVYVADSLPKAITMATLLDAYVQTKDEEDAAEAVVKERIRDEKRLKAKIAVVSKLGEKIYQSVNWEGKASSYVVVLPDAYTIKGALYYHQASYEFLKGIIRSLNANTDAEKEELRLKNIKLLNEQNEINRLKEQLSKAEEVDKALEENLSSSKYPRVWSIETEHRPHPNADKVPARILKTWDTYEEFKKENDKLFNSFNDSIKRNMKNV